VIDRRSLRRGWAALRSGVHGVRAAPGMFALSIATMAAGLLLLAAFLLVVRNMRTVLSSFGDDVRVIAYLAPPEAPDRARAEQLQRQLSALPGVAAVRFVPPDQALARLRADLGDQSDVLDGLESNPLPASFELEPEPALRDPALLGALVERVRGVPGLSDVRYGRDWIDGYARLVRAGEALGAVLGGLLALLLASITAGTVRLAVYARADEIQIQRLVGASGSFVRLPFYLEGALQGGLAAALALGALYLLYTLGLPLLREPLAWLLGPRQLAFFGRGELIALVGLGLALGLGGAVMSLLRLEESV
jgi:cell division transport system permease protein